MTAPQTDPLPPIEATEMAPPAPELSSEEGAVTPDGPEHSVVNEVEEDWDDPDEDVVSAGSSEVGFFGAGQFVDTDTGDVTPGRGALDHPAAQFLGREFLLWLWWRSEQSFGTMDLPHYGPVDFWIDDHIQFRTPGDDPQINDIRGGAPATTIEARTALANGKTVESARIGLRIKEREYSFSLRGEGLELTGVKVPADAGDGIDDRLFERMLLIEEVGGILDTMFFVFLESRLGGTWRGDRVPAIRNWIAGTDRKED